LARHYHDVLVQEFGRCRLLLRLSGIRALRRGDQLIYRCGPIPGAQAKVPSADH
jgi:hypothetical protein